MGLGRMSPAILSPVDRVLKFLTDSQFPWVKGPCGCFFQDCAPRQSCFLGLVRSPAPGKQGAAGAHICTGLTKATAAALNSGSLRGMAQVSGQGPRREADSDYPFGQRAHQLLIP